MIANATAQEASRSVQIQADSFERIFLWNRIHPTRLSQTQNGKAHTILFLPFYSSSGVASSRTGEGKNLVRTRAWTPRLSTLKRSSKKSSQNQNDYEKKLEKQGKPPPRKAIKIVAYDDLTEDEQTERLHYIHLDYDGNKQQYKHYPEPPPVELKELTVMTYRGHIVDEVQFPTLKDKKVQSLAPKSSIVEGGMM